WLGGLTMSQFLLMHVTALGLPPHVALPISVVAGGFVIVCLGLLDDLLKVAPWIKIVGQILAAGLLLASGLGTHWMHAFLDPISARLYKAALLSGPFFSEPVIIAISCLATTAPHVLCFHRPNLLAGLDGFCGCVT